MLRFWAGIWGGMLAEGGSADDNQGVDVAHLSPRRPLLFVTAPFPGLSLLGQQERTSDVDC
jgi:hypothetical protein